MKVVFDTNVYVAEALLGAAASRMVEATHSAGWRMYVSAYLLDELERVLSDNLGFSRRLGRALTSSPDPPLRVRRASGLPSRCSRRSERQSHFADRARWGADYLVTNDHHFLSLDPYQSLRIISMNDYERLLIDQGLLSPDA